MSKLKVLVADDQEVIRDFFERSLGSLGYECSLAPDGKSCLQRLSENDYDLLFLDLIMPGMDGQAVLRKIGAKERNLDVIIMSVQDDEMAIRELLSMGATAYLTKPFTTEQIAEIITRVEQKRAST